MSEKKGVNTSQLVFDLAKPIADELGLILWDVKFEKEGASWFLRLFVDKEGGIAIEDCEAISRPVNELLDELDPISQSYIFEVGSPGLGRELRRPEHFEKYLGEEVRVRFIRPIDGVKEKIGALDKYEKTIIVITDNDTKEQMSINLSECAYVRLYDDGNLF